jgi:patatin-like phospholipase/acyl hydrolase
MKKNVITRSSIFIFALIIIAIWASLGNFESDARKTIYSESSQVQCNNVYINFASQEYLRYEIKNVFDPNNRRSPPRTSRQIEIIKKVALANHIAAYNTSEKQARMTRTERRSQAEFVLKSNLYRLILKIKSKDYRDKYFALMPSIRAVNKDIYMKNCRVIQTP